MSARAITAVAVLTAALAGQTGRAAAQPLPDVQPAPPAGSAVGLSHVSGGYGPPAGNPYAAPMAPTGPAVMPAQGAFPMGPVMDPGIPVDSGFPTDGLGDSSGTAHGPRGWIGAEYLLYWTKRAPLSSPVATVGFAGTTATLNSPGTRVILGNSDFDFSNFSGLRVVGGYWVTQNETLAIEGSFFILPAKQLTTPRLVGTVDRPVLARPFFDTVLGTPSSRLLTSPGLFTGGVGAETRQQFWGAEIGGALRAYDYGWLTLDATAAFKFLNLEESLTITDFANAQGNGVAVFLGRGFSAPATTYVTDRFATYNRFYGGTVGGRANLHMDAFTWTVASKLGVGSMQEAVRIEGQSVVSGPFPTPLVAGGGFYGVGSNSGRFTRNRFAVVPEIATNLTVQVTRHLTVTLGYTYLYVSDVVRPGDQIGTRVNTTLVPTSQNFGARFGGQSPTTTLVNSNYWAQGINVGLTYGF